MSSMETVTIYFNDLKSAGFRHGGWLATVTDWAGPKTAPGLEFSKDWDSKNCEAKARVQPGQVLFAGCGKHGADSKVPTKLKFRHFYLVRRSHERRGVVARSLRPTDDARGLFLRSIQPDEPGSTYPVPTWLDGSRETTMHVAHATNDALNQLSFEGVRFDSAAPNVSTKALFQRVKDAIQAWPEFEPVLGHYELLLSEVLDARERARLRREQERLTAAAASMTKVSNEAP